MFPGNGTGTDLDWTFCSSNNPCKHGQGDCDDDSECSPGHVCGQDNCQNFSSQALATADCCVHGKNTDRTLTSDHFQFPPEGTTTTTPLSSTTTAVTGNLACYIWFIAFLKFPVRISQICLLKSLM